MKAVIFDLDGVLVSTDEYHYKAWKTIADQLSIPFDEHINNQLRGVSRMESLEIILKESNQSFSADEKSKLATAKNELYRQSLQNLSEKDILPGVVETLDFLSEKGIKLAVGSSSKNAPLILERVGLTNCFDSIVDGNQIENSKPDPEVFLKAAQILEIDPIDCLVVEDAIVGVEAGIRAGMKVAAVGDAKQSEQATYKVDQLTEILDTI